MKVEIPCHPDDEPFGKPPSIVFFCDRCGGPIATTGERRDEFETAETHLHPLGCPADQTSDGAGETRAGR